VSRLESSDASRWNDEIRRRLKNAGLEPAGEAAIVRELAQHLDDRFAELRSLDVDDAEATRRALAELDEHEIMTRELSRVARLEASTPVLGEDRQQSVLSGLWQDLRYGARSLRATPGFTIVAIITLTLAIGATTAVFSIVDAMLVQPLSADPDSRVVRMHRLHVSLGTEPVETRTRRHEPSFPLIRQWQQQRADLFEAIGAVDFMDLTLVDSDPVERVSAALVTPALLRVFDASALLVVRRGCRHHRG
jgi:hypothetical protein